MTVLLQLLVFLVGHCKKNRNSSSCNQNLRNICCEERVVKYLKKSPQIHSGTSRTISWGFVRDFYLKCPSPRCVASWRYPCQDCVTEQVRVPLYSVWGLGSYKPLIQRRMRPVLVRPDDLGSSSDEQDRAATLHTQINAGNCRSLNRWKSAATFRLSDFYSHEQLIWFAVQRAFLLKPYCVHNDPIRIHGTFLEEYKETGLNENDLTAGNRQKINKRMWHWDRLGSKLAVLLVLQGFVRQKQTRRFLNRKCVLFLLLLPQNNTTKSHSYTTSYIFVYLEHNRDKVSFWKQRGIHFMW